jgi:hypothetical protein
MAVASVKHFTDPKLFAELLGSSFYAITVPIPEFT